MPRETKKQRDARVSMLLAEYDEKSRQLRKLEADVKALKDQLRELPSGTYADWVLSEGTPREILDQPAVKALLAELGKAVPMATTRAPIIVSHVAATASKR